MKESKTLPMKLQFFAENGDGGKETNGNDNPSNQEPKSTEPENTDPEVKTEKTFTQSDVDKIVADKLKENEEQRKEDEKLGNMSKEQQLQHKLEEAEKNSDNSQKELSKYRMRDTAREMAKNSGISLEEEDINHIVTHEANSTKTNIDWLTNYTNRITQKVKNDLATGNPPKKNGQNISKTESLGSRLAQQNNSNVENPYFK